MNFACSLFGLYLGTTYGFYLRENTNIREGIVALKGSFKKKDKKIKDDIEMYEKMKQISEIESNTYSYNKIGPAIDKFRIKDIDKEYNKLQNKVDKDEPFKQIFK